MSATGAASPWLLRWAHLIPPGGRVVDLAAGSGRHTRWLAAQGFAVTAVDRDAAAMAAAVQASAATMRRRFGLMRPPDEAAPARESAD